MKKKRLLTLLGSVCLALVLVALLLPACAKEAPAPPAPAPAPAPTPAKVIEWKCQSHHVLSDIAVAYWLDLEERLSEMTGGRFKVKWYWAGDLVKTTDVLDAVETGMLEMGAISAYYYAGIIPEAAIEYGLPYGMSTTEMNIFMHGIESPRGLYGVKGAVDFLRPIYAEHNAYYIDGSEGWPGAIMFTSPINSVNDIKGKKIRVSGLMVDWVEKLGGTCVYIPGEETYTALATGALDGVSWGGAIGMLGMKFYEVCPYYLMPEVMTYVIGNVIANMDNWNALPDDIKGILEVSVRDTGITAGNQIMVDQSWARKQMVDNYGVTINELTGADLAKAKDAAHEIWDEQAARSPRCAEFVNMIKDYMRSLGELD